MQRRKTRCSSSFITSRHRLVNGCCLRGSQRRIKMASCFLCSSDLAPVIAESNYWRLVLNINQNFPGKCMWVLRRHIEPVPDLSAEEWAELHLLIGRTRDMLHGAFQPDHYNY